MSRHRYSYKDLKAKVSFLMDDEMAQRAGGHDPNFNSFAKATKVDRTQLAEAIGDPGTSDGRRPGDDKLSRMNAERIASTCKFDHEWPEFKVGTCDEFKKRYREHRRQQVERRKDVRLRVKRSDRPWSYDEHLATVELFASQAGTGAPWGLTFELICNAAPLEGIEMAVRRGRLQLDCGAARITEEEQGRGTKLRKLVKQTDNTKVTLSPGGTSQRPSWEIWSDKGAIGILSFSEEPLCELYGLAPGDVVRARFIVYFKDLDDEEVDDAEPESGQSAARLESFLRPGYRTLGSTAKRKILNRMRQLQLPDGDQGWAVLCRHDRTFEASDDGQAE